MSLDRTLEGLRRISTKLDLEGRDKATARILLNKDDWLEVLEKVALVPDESEGRDNRYEGIEIHISEYWIGPPIDLDAMERHLRRRSNFFRQDYLADFFLDDEVKGEKKDD